MKDVTRKTPQPVLYEQHRIRLEQERMDLQHAISETEEQFKLLNYGRVNGVVEEGTISDRELLLEKSSYCRRRLKTVLQGLERIRDGTFGQCVGCENPIAEKRLQALPSAQYCISCQERLEQGKISQEPSATAELESVARLLRLAPLLGNLE